MSSGPNQPLHGAPAARVLVAGANGFTGALAAKIVWDHPRLQLVAATSRSDAGKRIDALYPRYRVPMTLTELDLGDADLCEPVLAAATRLAAGAKVPVINDPRSVMKTLSLPAAWHLSTACFMSHGETNCPFLMFTGRSLSAAAITRSV